jgi:hypothetical protein
LVNAASPMNSNAWSPRALALASTSFRLIRSPARPEKSTRVSAPVFEAAVSRD